MTTQAMQALLSSQNKGKTGPPSLSPVGTLKSIETVCQSRAPAAYKRHEGENHEYNKLSDADSQSLASLRELNWRCPLAGLEFHMVGTMPSASMFWAPGIIPAW